MKTSFVVWRHVVVTVWLQVVSLDEFAAESAESDWCEVIMEFYC